MERSITSFARLLRQNGVRVAAPEIADAVAGAAVIGLDERTSLQDVLATTLIKRQADRPIFLRLFAAFFGGRAEVLAGLDQGAAEAALLALPEVDAARLREELAAPEAARSELTQALLAGDLGALARLLEAARAGLPLEGAVTPLQAGFLSRRLLAGAGAGRTERELAAIAAGVRRRGGSEALEQELLRRLVGALDRFGEAARRLVLDELNARLQSRRRTLGLEDRALHSLSREELRRCEEAVRQIAQKLKAKLARRQSRDRRGALHVRRTLRRNMGNGGVPMDLAFRRRRPGRPELVVLCDVSDSVRTTTRLMLLFVHSLQVLFSRVRTFAFVADVGEISDALRRAKAEAAIDLSVAEAAINVHASSNYGRSLARFAARYGGSMGQRTTVLVVGDGRGNYQPPEVDALVDVRRRARRLVWICTEERTSWGLGDSDMPRYAPACDQVLVVRTLADLEAMAEQLLPSTAPRRRA